MNKRGQIIERDLKKEYDSLKKLKDIKKRNRMIFYVFATVFVVLIIAAVVAMYFYFSDKNVDIDNPIINNTQENPDSNIETENPNNNITKPRNTVKNNTKRPSTSSSSSSSSSGGSPDSNPPVPCTPDCINKQCGESDGCGKKCLGLCKSGYHCTSSFVCEIDCTSNKTCEIDHPNRCGKNMFNGCSNSLDCSSKCGTDICYTGPGDITDVCVSPNNMCLDTDNGINSFVKGTASISGINMQTDSCMNIKDLNETYCYYNSDLNKTEIRSQKMTCSINCTNGACFNEMHITRQWLSSQPKPDGPYVLDLDNVIYILETDVTVNGSAFLIGAKNATLDLNGHTITYADFDHQGLINPGFEIPDITDPRKALGWDLSNAPHAYRQDSTEHLSFGNYSLHMNNPVKLKAGIVSLTENKEANSNEFVGIQAIKSNPSQDDSYGKVSFGQNYYPIYYAMSDETVTTQNRMDNGQWIHVVGIRTLDTSRGAYPASEIKLYINGTLVGKVGNTIPNYEYHYKNFSDSIWNIGRRPDVKNQEKGTGDYFKGEIDEVKIWKRNLSEVEILQDYNGNLILNGLAAYYPLDSNANDLSGNNNHGKNYSVIYHPTEGKNGAAEFNGIDSYIDLGYNPSMQIDSNTPITISAWIKIEPDDMIKDYTEEYVVSDKVDLPLPGSYAAYAMVRGGPYADVIVINGENVSIKRVTLDVIYENGTEVNCSQTLLHGNSYSGDMLSDVSCLFDISKPEKVRARMKLNTALDNSTTYMDIDQFDIRPHNDLTFGYNNRGMAAIKPLNYIEALYEIKNGTIIEGRSKAIYAQAIYAGDYNGISGIQKLHDMKIITNGMESMNIRASGVKEVYNNIFVANGENPLNRQYPFSMLGIYSDGVRIYNNTFLNGSQSGIGISCVDCLNKNEIYGNTIKLRTIATNGVAISTGSNTDIYDNIIDPIQGHGIGLYANNYNNPNTSSNISNVRIFNNLILPKTWPCDEYASSNYVNSAHGIRLKTTNGGKLINITVYNNTIIGSVNPQAPNCYTQVDGIYVMGTIEYNDIKIYNNNITVSTDNATHQQAAAYIHGGYAEVYNNTFKSNNIILELSDGNSNESQNVRFVSNTLIRGENPSLFHTIQYQYFVPYNNTFVDTRLFNRANLSDIDGIEGTHFNNENPESNITISWNLNIYVHNDTGPIPSANIKIYDVDNNLLKDVSSDSFGKSFNEIIEYIRHYNSSGREWYTRFSPYNITISKDGKIASEIINLNRTIDLDVNLESGDMQGFGIVDNNMISNSVNTINPLEALINWFRQIFGLSAI